MNEYHLVELFSKFKELSLNLNEIMNLLRDSLPENINLDSYKLEKIDEEQQVCDSDCEKAQEEILDEQEQEQEEVLDQQEQEEVLDQQEQEEVLNGKEQEEVLDQQEQEEVLNGKEQEEVVHEEEKSFNNYFSNNKYYNGIKGSLIIDNVNNPETKYSYKRWF